MAQLQSLFGPRRRADAGDGRPGPPTTFASQLQTASGTASLTGAPVPASTAGQAVVERRPRRGRRRRATAGLQRLPADRPVPPGHRRLRRRPMVRVLHFLGRPRGGRPARRQRARASAVSTTSTPGPRSPARRSRTAEGVVPQPGDLIVWDEHIGVVDSVGADGTINTIEGNSSDQVSRRTYAPGLARRDRLRPPRLICRPRLTLRICRIPRRRSCSSSRLERERAERSRRAAADDPPEERTHERRADRHAYLRDKLSERAESEDEVADDDDG